MLDTCREGPAGNVSVPASKSCGHAGLSSLTAAHSPVNHLMTSSPTPNPPPALGPHNPFFSHGGSREQNPKSSLGRLVSALQPPPQTIVLAGDKVEDTELPL